MLTTGSFLNVAPLAEAWQQRVSARTIFHQASSRTGPREGCCTVKGVVASVGDNQAYVVTVDHRWTDLLKVILNNLRTAPYRPRGHHHSHEMEVSRGRDACEQKTKSNVW
jgi:hypothetical protein